MRADLTKLEAAFKSQNASNMNAVVQDLGNRLADSEDLGEQLQREISRLDKAILESSGSNTNAAQASASTNTMNAAIQDMGNRLADQEDLGEQLQQEISRLEKSILESGNSNAKVVA